MSAFADIVGEANTMVKGIDWDKLESESRGVPLDPNVDAKLGYWVDYLAPAFDKAADVMNTLYYDPQIVNVASTQSSMDVMYRLLKDVAPEMQAYQRLNNLSLLFSPLPLPIKDFRTMISYVWGVIMFGVKLHTTFAITAVGRQKWREHADHIVRLCNALAALESFGALSRLKWNAPEMVSLRAEQGVSSLRPFTDNVQPSLSGPEGLGVTLQAIGIVVGAAILIYAIYEWSSVTTEINKQTLDTTQKLCADPSYANDPVTKERCVKVLGDALARSTMIKPPTSDLFKYAIIAVSVGAAIWFLPTIVRSLRGAAAEARKPATA